MTQPIGTESPPFSEEPLAESDFGSVESGEQDTSAPDQRERGFATARRVAVGAHR